MPSIEETILAALAADEDVVALVADRIYPGQVPDDEATTPWLYYSVVESLPQETLDGVDAVRHQVEFHALADRYGQAKAIVAAVQAVVGALPTSSTVSYAAWDGTSQEVTEDGYHHAARFTVDEPAG